MSKIDLKNLGDLKDNKMVKEAAKNASKAADLNGDGKVDMKDLKAAEGKAKGVVDSLKKSIKK